MKTKWEKGNKGNRPVALVSFASYPFLHRRSTICDDAHDIGVGNQLAFNFSFSTHPLHTRTNAQRGDFQRQGVARDHRLAKTRLPDTGKQNQLRVAILNFPQGQYGPHLRQSFHDQNTRHDWRTGEVSLKKGFVNADLLDTDDAFPRDQLDNSID